MAKKPAGPGAPRGQSVSLRRSDGRSTAQQKWLLRQLNDPYVIAAKREGLRSRAAYKLSELDDRFHLIRPGIRVLDLGAAPGGWAQIALRRGAAKVVGIDLLDIDSVPGAVFLKGDFMNDAAPDNLMAELGGAPDLVLSDMAPNTTGHTATDHLRIMALAELAADFAMRVLPAGGSFVTKLFAGGAERTLLTVLKQGFTVVRHAKPPASRKDSSELYLVATGFKGRPQEDRSADRSAD